MKEVKDEAFTRLIYSCLSFALIKHRKSNSKIVAVTKLVRLGHKYSLDFMPFSNVMPIL